MPKLFSIAATPIAPAICRRTRWSLFRPTDLICLAHSLKANVQALRQWDHALQVQLASKRWIAPQRDWLKRIAAQTRANLLMDLEALDNPDLVFKREGGGLKRLNKIFGGELYQVLEGFNKSLWLPAAA
ncbi:MAG: hypothetical protein IPI89_02145 [Propionivibrio sp.]|nr:hypothetical protein [Propionivibrio sp.]